MLHIQMCNPTPETHQKVQGNRKVKEANETKMSQEYYCKDIIALTVHRQSSILQDPSTLKQYESNLSA